MDPSTPMGAAAVTPGRTGRAGLDHGSGFAMTCGEFLALHSEYLDEELGAEAAAAMRLHLAGCSRCARYDRVLRHGLDLVRGLEPVVPSTDSYLALHQHLARTTPPPSAVPPRAPFAATIAVAGVVALVAWSALFRATGVPSSAAGESAPGATDADGAAEVVAGSGPGMVEPAGPTVIAGMDVVTPILPSRARPAWPHASSMLVPTRAPLPMPGPYTPLLLRPPEYGQSADGGAFSAAPR